MLSFIRECGNSTAGSSARLALRMRVNMSEIGSLIIILPAGLGHAGNQAVQRGFAERQARTAELAQITVAAAADIEQRFTTRVGLALRGSFARPA